MCEHRYMCAVKIEKVVELVVEVVEVQVVEVWNGRRSGGGGNGKIYLISINKRNIYPGRRDLGPITYPRSQVRLRFSPTSIFPKCVSLHHPSARLLH